MKIAYLSGPANGPLTYEEWERGTQAFFGTDYMRQFLKLATDLDAESCVITWHGDTSYKKVIGSFTFVNLPLKVRVHYYTAQLIWHLKILWDLGEFRPDLIILTGNQNFWWVLSPLRLLGSRFLPSFHCTLWPKFGRTKTAWRLFLQLEKRLIFKQCPIVVATSHDIGRQLAQLTSSEVIYHLPTWDREQFASVPPPSNSEPFCVFFAGRIEVNKGIMDLLAMAKQLPDVRFDVCGTGSALELAQSSSPKNVVFHGFCDQESMRKIMGRSHVCVVPTRTDFEAGFEMTCAEAILAGRPLVTSRVSPALEYVSDASIEAKPDDVDSYVDAIRILREDAVLYERKQRATSALSEQFYDSSNSWLHAMSEAISRICRN